MYPGLMPSLTVETADAVGMLHACLAQPSIIGEAEAEPSADE